MPAYTIVEATPGEVLSAGIVLLVFNIAAVGGRFAARHVQGLDYMLDDWLTIPALLANITIFIAEIWGVAVGALATITPQPPAGTNALDFENFDIQATKKVTWITELAQCVGLACTKLSFLFFYRRIFFTGKKGLFHWLTCALIAVCIAWGVAFFFRYIAECHGDLAAWWTDIRTLNNKCPAGLKLEAGFAISDTAVDLVIFTIPLVMIWTLRMSMSKKIALTTVFGIGAMAVAASIVRMLLFAQSSLATFQQAYQKRGAGADDALTTTDIYWGMLESGLSLIACCLPSIYKPTREYVQSLLRNRRQLPSDPLSHDQAAATANAAAGMQQVIHKPTDVSLIFANQSVAATDESSAIRSRTSELENGPPNNGIGVEYAIRQQEEHRRP